ncbi:ankyrin repeat-containing domain protein [Mycena galericulata]|nr:ankyrin repeat-containing domain protein [Mycena galericulata]
MRLLLWQWSLVDAGAVAPSSNSGAQLSSEDCWPTTGARVASAMQTLAQRMHERWANPGPVDGDIRSALRRQQRCWRGFERPAKGGCLQATRSVDEFIVITTNTYCDPSQMPSNSSEVVATASDYMQPTTNGELMTDSWQGWILLSRTNAEISTIFRGPASREPGVGYSKTIVSSSGKQWEAGFIGTLGCCGIPGSGKTVLASVVVEHLEARSMDENIGTACMYLNHKEADTQTVSNLLASLWSQLVVGMPISPLAQELHRRHSEKRTRPKVDEMFNVLCSIICEWPRVYIVVDALDEYPEDERNALVGYLTALGPTVNLMVTSRPHIAPSAFLPNVETIEIRATEKDIRTYTHERIQKSHRLSMHVKTRPELREEIERKIIGSVDGMFLLAKLHIDSLATKNTIKAVREALENLPKDLERTYDEAMERIDRQNDEDKKIAHSALTWVANAKRILSVAELREALAIEPGSKRLDPDNRLEIDLILSVCAGLVVVDESSSVVRLVHYTTQRYLDIIQDRRFPEAHTEITRALLTYLAFDPDRFDLGLPSKSYIAEYPLLGYCHYCFIHAVGRPEIVLSDLILSFLGQAGEWKSQMFTLWSTPPWYMQQICFISLNTYLLDNEVSHNNAGKLGAAPLCAASYYGHIQMTELLLERGVDINEANQNPFHLGFNHALLMASSEGHERAVRLLLKNGAEVNSGSALAKGSYKGHEGVVRLLLEFGADVNATDKNHGSALLAASEQGHYDTVCLLLENGAGMNFKDEWGNDAVQVASSAGYESVVRLLFERGADANAVGGTYGSALGAASWGGHYDTVLFLLEQGAGVDLMVRSDALRYATFSGHEDVVRLLLERGADVNAYHGNALMIAAVNGQISMVRLLVEKGADVNSKDSDSTDALQRASCVGHESVVRLLIESGADMNAADGLWGSPLVATSMGGYGSVVRLLLEQGADINTKSETYGDALQVASSCGRESVVRLLLEWGADLNGISGPFGSALMAASELGHEKIVRLLLEQGANVDLKDRESRDALQLASYWGCEGVVRLLLEWGADANAVGGTCGSALMAALKEGHDSIVSLLFEKGAKDELFDQYWRYEDLDRLFVEPDAGAPP